MSYQQNPVLSIIGLGKLGLPMAAVFSSSGLIVWGYDKNIEAANAMENAIPHIFEPELNVTLDKGRANLRKGVSIADCVARSDISFLVLPTPSLLNGAFSHSILEDAIRDVGKSLREKKDFHLVTVTSTVMPGASDDIFIPLLESSSGKICGIDFGYAYNPEFIALGSVIRDFSKPDFVLIGESDKKTGDILEGLYKNICGIDTFVARMNPVSAELTKISLNCFCTMKIAFANSIAELSSHFMKANASIITSAIGLDSRIGKKYLNPGLGFGGPCFPRDNQAFIACAKEKGIAPLMQESVIVSNERWKNTVIERVLSLSNKGSKIAILGLTYKPGAYYCESSQALDIARALAGQRDVSIFDPAFTTMEAYDSNINSCKTINDAIYGASLVVIATPWRDFYDITSDVFVSSLKAPKIVLDCWNLRPDLKNCADIKYISVGNIGHV